MNRRDFLAGAAALAAAPLLPATALSTSAAGLPVGTARRPFRFAFFTDTHHKNVSTGLAIERAVRDLKRTAPDVRLVVHGGDLLNTADLQPSGVSQSQMGDLKRLMAEAKLDFRAVMGNHDLANLKETSDPLYGKALFQREIGPLRQRFEAGGLTFLLLDTVQIQGESFTGGVDAETLAWLDAQLAAIDPKNPIVTVGHIPLFTIMPSYEMGAMMSPTAKFIVANAKAVRDRFKGHRVVAHLQGHTHVGETCDDLTTKFVTGGAVCGDWWKGARLGRYEPGYCVCSWDGKSFSWNYETYDWQPVVN